MAAYSDLRQKRESNARALAAFGVQATGSGTATVRTIREGTKITIYTVGYERRDGDDLMSVLRDQGVKALADVRERPMSRKPDFRGAALREFCKNAGIEYQPWSMLGSNDELRDELQSSGDFGTFAKQFRALAKKTMKIDLDRLAESVKRIPTALMCYERLHEDCHRSVIAELIADDLDATVVAIQ